MAVTATPFLMFEGRAEAAMTFYAAHIPGAKVTALERYGAGQPGPEGQVYRGEMEIGGRTFRFFDSPVHHQFTFTPAVSIFLDCADAAEVDRVYAALVEDGQALMGLGDYGFSKKFGWVNDRFGVSWQINLP